MSAFTNSYLAQVGEGPGGDSEKNKFDWGQHGVASYQRLGTATKEAPLTMSVRRLRPMAESQS